MNMDQNQIDEPIESAVSQNTQPGKSKWILLVLLVAGVMIAYWQFGGTLSLDYLAEREFALRRYRDSSPWLTALIATVVYVAITGLSIPGAAVLTLVYGWYFGFLQAIVIVSFGSTGGATVAFLLTRYFFRDIVERKFATSLKRVQSAMQREGAFYLFTLRLLPPIPFFVVNALMGLTQIPVATYWWVSQVGMFPATVAYVYAGSRFPSLQLMASEGVGQVLSWQLLSAFAIIGALPLAIKWILNRYRVSSTFNSVDDAA